MSVTAPAAPAPTAAPTPASAPATEPKTTSTPASTPNKGTPTPVTSPTPGAAPASEPPKPDAAAPATPPDPTKPHKIVVNGKEEWISTEDAIKLAQIGKGANAKFEEAARMRKQNEQFLELLKANPRAVLANPKLGLDFRKIAEEYLLEQINLEKMTPEQKQVHEMQEKLKALEAEKEEAKKQAESAQQEELVKHHTENYQREIIEALKTSDLPKTRFVVKQIGYYMALGLERGVPLKAVDVLPLVRDDVHRNYRDFFGAADVNLVAELMGEEGVKKLMEFQAAKVRPPSPAPTLEVIKPVPDKKLSPEEWRKLQDERFGR